MVTKKTAIDWFVQELRNGKELNDNLIEQAKKLEKQQMRNASCPYVGGWEDDDEFEYWYKENFNN